MAREDYEVVMGLEVHAELSTNTKIFCSCPTKFGAEPNTQVCPICMAMPGTLPKLNEKVVEYAVRAGLATNCEISRNSKNDRKNYFYPDLPKAYQISQFDKPLCEHGYIEIETSKGRKKIGITRIHIEEDAGKLNHDEIGGGALVDLNRAGVPLIEIVSEPDFRSIEEVDAYLKKLKSILEYIEVSDCKMQEGSFRADVNTSIRPVGSEKFGTRTEMKNMNSFRSITRALEYEIDRQVDVIDNGGEVEQETLRWDEVSGKTFSMRDKEDEVEKIGVEKSIKQANDADLIIAIFDSSKDLEEEDIEILNLIKGKKSIILLNKSDLNSKINENDDRFTSITENILRISALNKYGIDELYEKIAELFNLNEINLDNEILITNIRHKNIISKSLEIVNKAKEALEINMPIDIITIYIKEILEDLGEITGEVVTEDIINEIFSKFCLGK